VNGPEPPEVDTVQLELVTFWRVFDGDLIDPLTDVGETETVNGGTDMDFHAPPTPIQ
jgi:hypothetical protein